MTIGQVRPLFSCPSPKHSFTRHLPTYLFTYLHTYSGVIPDIVTTGKPIGNGFPLSAVVTRKEVGR